MSEFRSELIKECWTDIILALVGFGLVVMGVHNDNYQQFDGGWALLIMAYVGIAASRIELKVNKLV